MSYQIAIAPALFFIILNENALRIFSRFKSLKVFSFRLGLLLTETKSELRLFSFGFRQDFVVFNWAQFEDEKRTNSERDYCKKVPYKMFEYA